MDQGLQVSLLQIAHRPFNILKAITMEDICISIIQAWQSLHLDAVGKIFMPLKMEASFMDQVFHNFPYQHVLLLT